MRNKRARLYLVRHGQTELNKRQCYYGREDVPLSEKGLEQALEIGFKLRDVSFDTVISSPLVRAVKTAEIVTMGTGVPLIIDQRLSEQSFGIFEGLTYQEIKGTYPGELDAWNRDYETFRIPGGESFFEVRSRVDSFREDLSGREGTILLVAHKGTLGHLTAGLLGLSLQGYWNFVFDQGSYSIIDLEDGYAILRRINV